MYLPACRALRDPDWQVRAEAAIVLGRMGLAGAVAPALVASLADDFWQVRKEAAVALGKLGASAAAPALLRFSGFGARERAHP